MNNRILQFEDNKEILTYKFSYKNELVWPYIRGMICEKAFVVANNSQNLNGNINKEASHLKNNVNENPFLLGETDIVFIHSTSYFVTNEKNELFDKLIDCYANLYKKNTGKLEFECIVQKHPYRNRNFKKVKYLDFIDNIVEAKYKLHLHNFEKQDVSMAEKCTEYIRNNFPIKFEEGFYFGLRKHILSISIKIKYYHELYFKLIKQINPKIVFVDCACYGGVRASCILKIANNLGIATGEFQHGNIIENIEYQYPESFSESSYIDYLPKYYLIFGKYWDKIAKVPIKKVVIGYPYLNSKLKDDDYSENSILIISDWTMRDIYINIVKQFCEQDNMKKYKIIFRIHPLDKKNIEMYSELLKYKNVSISEEMDLYDDINKCKYIVGGFSTALFECIPFKRRIFIIDNDCCRKYMDEDVGEYIRDGQELFEILKNGDKEVDKNKCEEYFSFNWKENYQNFIEKIIYN